MSLNKDQLNTFFKYYENMKLREASSYTYTYGGLFNKDSITSKKFEGLNISNLLKNKSLFSIKDIDKKFSDFLNQNKTWNSRISWFEPNLSGGKYNKNKYLAFKQNVNINTPSKGILLNNKDQIEFKTSGNQLHIESYVLGVKIADDQIDKLNADADFKKAWNSVGHVFGGQTEDFYIKFEICMPPDYCVDSQGKPTGINCIDLDTFLSSFSNKASFFPKNKTISPENFFFIRDRFYLTNACLIPALQKLNAPQTSGNSSQNMTNYNTFTVMQLNAVQRSIEATLKNENVINFFQKNSVNFITEAELGNNKIKSTDVFNKLKDELGETPVFNFQFSCKQNQPLKEAQRMGTAFSKGIENDKNTNISEAVMEITVKVIPTPEAIKAYEAYAGAENLDADIYKTLLNFENNKEIIEKINTEFKPEIIDHLNKNKRMNKITYKDTVFNLQYTDLNSPETKILAKDIFQMSLIVTKSGSRNSVASMAGKILRAL